MISEEMSPVLIIFGWVCGLATGMSLVVLETPYDLRALPMHILTVLLYIFFFWMMIKRESSYKEKSK
jgi:hypothetical protein